MKNIYENTAFLDKRACERFALSEEILMENAANALETLLATLTHKGSVVTILCGSGDNGGDGYALARRLSGDYKVRIYQAKEPKSPLCVKNFNRACECEVKFINKILPCDVVVDCLFGSGFRGEIDKDTHTLLHLAYKNARIRIACDLPSGLSLKTHSSSYPIFKADYTLCMGALKLCVFSDYAKEYVGHVSVGNLGLSNALYEVDSNIKLLEKSDFTPPYRTQSNVHKGHFGHVAILGGEKLGAAILAGQSTLSFGAGLVSLLFWQNELGKKQDESKINKHNTESKQTTQTQKLMQNSPESSLFQSKAPTLFSNESTTSETFLESQNPLSIKTHMLDSENMTDVAFSTRGGAQHFIPPELMCATTLPENTSVLALGAGLGRSEESIQSALSLAHKALLQQIPCVLDADIFHSPLIGEFLDTLAGQDCEISKNQSEAKSESRAETKLPALILTPHPKEFVALLKHCNLFSPKEATEDKMSLAAHIEHLAYHRLEYMQDFVRKYPFATLLLKGANVFIAHKTQVYINPLGSQALAKGGSGDVLGGIIAALLAQGYDGLNATIQGSLAHTLASRNALQKRANYALTPNALIEALSNL